jgi:SAM-dependent methyltransferase
MLVHCLVRDAMPTIAWNRGWDNEEWWPQNGDGWSTAWGDAETQWHASILPRIRHFFPAPSVLEIAPGHGRWSQFLVKGSSEYTGVDLNPECTETCRRRFNNVPHAKFVTNDGKSLDAVEDGSIDFAFSFDSLVHVELDVLSAYIEELAKKLSPDGVAFLHHSNLGEYNSIALKLAKKLHSVPKPWPFGAALIRLQLSDWDQWRAASVTARHAAKAAERSGLACIRQEVVNWGPHNVRLIDCMTTLTRAGSQWSGPLKVVRNPYFMSEAASAKRTSRSENFR